MPEPQGRNPQTTVDTRPERDDKRKEIERKDGDVKNGQQRPIESRAFADAEREAETNLATAVDFWNDAWRPFGPISVIQTEMARWMDDMWQGAISARAAPSLFMRTPTSGLPIAGIAGLPRADVREAADHFQVQVELPGLRLRDIDVRLDGDDLVVRGTKSEAERRKETDYRLSERRFGRFERRFTLSRDIDPDRTEAEFNDGVLNVTIPKRADRTPPERRIEVRGRA